MSKSKSKEGNQEYKSLQDEIADIAIKLTRHPETQTLERLNRLYDLSKSKDNDVSRKAILSLAAVLFDILPNYSIGKHSSSDNPSKEIRKRREYEQMLLDFTRRFIQLNEMLAFGRNNPMQVRTASAKALAGIFEKKPLFNTGKHLTSVVLRLSSYPIPRFRQIGCTAIANVFSCDPSLELTLMIASELPVLKIENISVDLLATLMKIHLKHDADLKPKETIEPSKEKGQKGKKADEDDIQDEYLKRELRKHGVIDSKSDLRKNQATILSHLFATVFRFLRETKSENHFIAAMHIIRDKVHFINYEYAVAIIPALKQSRFSLRACISGTQTALCVCQTASLTIDLRDFYVTVYSRAYEALEDHSALLELLALFDIISKERETNRTAAFAKRLMVMALLATPDVTAAILSTIRSITLEHPQFTEANDFDFQGEGEYQLLGDDPDFCNGKYAKNWELAEFTHSPSKIVRDIATDLAKLVDNDAVIQSRIREANSKENWNPRKVLEALDDSARIFDTTLLTVEQRPRPKTFKKFDF